MYTRRQLTADPRSLGVVPGDVIMVHASGRSVGEVPPVQRRDIIVPDD